MMMYTIVPPDILMRTDAPSRLSSRTRAYRGGYLEITDTPEGGVVNRVISTNPADYLDPGLQPGSAYRPRRGR